MGALIILIAGIWGATFVNKRTFLESWCFFINLVFSLYTAIFISPLLSACIDIKSINEVYKICGSLVIVTIVLFLILSKIIGQIFPETNITVKIPHSMQKLGTMISLFCSASIIAALILFCFTSLPVSKKIQLPDSIRSHSKATLSCMIKTVNFFSFQSVSPAGEETLLKVGIYGTNQENLTNEKKSDKKNPEVKESDSQKNLKKSDKKNPEVKESDSQEKKNKKNKKKKRNKKKSENSDSNQNRSLKGTEKNKDLNNDKTPDQTDNK